MQGVMVGKREPKRGGPGGPAMFRFSLYTLKALTHLSYQHFWISRGSK